MTISKKVAQAPQLQQPPLISVQLDELAPLSGKQNSRGFPCRCQVRPAREVCLSLLSRNICLGSIGSSSTESALVLGLFHTKQLPKVKGKPPKNLQIHQH